MIHVSNGNPVFFGKVFCAGRYILWEETLLDLQKYGYWLSLNFYVYFLWPRGSRGRIAFPDPNVFCKSKKVSLSKNSAV